jgi:hypothetical protein
MGRFSAADVLMAFVFGLLLPCILIPSLLR